jgi:hypothetical protein
MRSTKREKLPRLFLPPRDAHIDQDAVPREATERTSTLVVPAASLECSQPVRIESGPTKMEGRYGDKTPAFSNIGQNLPLSKNAAKIFGQPFVKAAKTGMVQPDCAEENDRIEFAACIPAEG